MRRPRLKIDPEIGEAVYHCTTRTVNGERLFDEIDREVLRRILWMLAEFCGLQILTHGELSNHFHVDIVVPKRTEVSDAELIRRYLILHPKHRLVDASLRAQWLATPQGQAWRRRQLALMGDVSAFMKLVKQRFTIWFNKTHHRYGTLWACRFNSTLKEKPIAIVGAYIDLNCVRAGLASDPKDYRFCGYGEAVAGHEKAQAGICRLLGIPDWEKAQPAYRLLLYSLGSALREGAASISPEQLQQVIAQGGKLPLSDVLRCRIRYFTDGAVLGSRAFVEAQIAAYRQRTGRPHKTGPQPLPPITDWGEDLHVFHPLRGRALG